MPKATIQYPLDHGFRAEQFGGPGDFETAGTGYLARVLQDAEALVRTNIGNLEYDAVTDDQSLAWLRLRRAEECAVRAELWSRRAAFIDGSSAQAMDKAAWQERREYLRSADAAAAECAHWLDAFLAGAESPADAAVVGLSGTVVVSGPWPRTANA
jgi:hypothetical protein